MNFLISDQELKVNLKTYDINVFPKEETLMSIGNGRIVSRATNDEANSAYSRETYISGFFDRNREHEVEELVNVPDALEYQILVNGVKLDLNSTNIYDYEKTLDLRYGILSKSFMVYHGDLEVFIKSQKHCDMSQKNILVQTLDFSTNKPAKIRIIDKIDGQYSNQGLEHFTYDEKYVKEGVLCYFTKTNDGKELFISSKLETDCEVKHNYSIGRKLINRETMFSTSAEKIVSLTKKIEYSTEGFSDCASDFNLHKAEWDKLWNQARVEVKGNKELQQALDFSIYHLIINSNLEDENTNLAAKGMTGFGYKGHTFWDTEIFLLPFYISNFPEKSKSLLKYRRNSLEQAISKAKKYGFDGAMMPWEGTRPSSPDATPEYGPINIKNGQAEKIINAEKELHINSAVVYGFELYFHYTNDLEFIQNYGVKVIVEIAKFWLSRLEYNQESDSYEILDVVGPDEYKEHVNNNMYTNFTARHTIRLIKEWFELSIIKAEDLIGFDLEQALEIADKIKLQSPNEENIIGQDDSYLDLEVIDLSKFKKSSKVAEINKYYSMAEKCKIQVSKQADLLLLFQMYRDQFNQKLVHDNFLYYEDKCLHDSSLSLASHSIVASDLKQVDLAYEFLKKSFAIDYNGDINSSNEGIHFASMGGHWLSIIRGFINVYADKKLEISPMLPKDIESISFSMYYRGCKLILTVKKSSVFIENQGEVDIECLVYDKLQLIKGGDQIEISK